MILPQRKKVSQHFFSVLFFFLVCSLILVLFTSLVYYILYSDNNILYLDIFSAENTQVDIYSTYQNQPFTEEKKISLDIRQGRHKYRINTYQIPVDQFYFALVDQTDNSDRLSQLNIISVLHKKIFQDDEIFSPNQENIFLPKTIKANFIADYLASLLEKYSQLPIQEKEVLDLLDKIVLCIVLLTLIFIKNKRYSIGFLIIVSLSVYYFSNANSTVLSILFDTTQNSRLQTFWKTDKEVNIFDENKSKSVNYPSGLNEVKLPLISLNNIDKIRIDPGDNSKIYSIAINAPGYKTIQTNYLDKFSLLSFDNAFISNDFLQLDFNNIDSSLFFHTKAEEDKNAIYLLQIIAFVILFIFTIIYLLPQQKKCFCQIIQVVPLIIFLYILYLSSFSWYNAHPDEQAHIASVNYYTEYTLPPKVGDPRSILTYQYPWGVSRLDNLGISYLFFGKLKVLLSEISNNSTFNARAFNCLLFGILALLCFKNKNFAYYCLPLFCIPQVWYLFSYANRGGFALFIAILIGWQLVNKKSFFNQYLKPEQKVLNYLVLPMSILTGLLAIEQSNYLSFILFFLVLLCYPVFLLKNRIPMIKKIIFFLSLIFLFVAGRYSYDVSINGFNKLEQQIAIAEQLAAPEFKPSIAHTDQSYEGLRLYEKGVQVAELFNEDWDWHTRTFNSFTGFYGGEQGLLSAQWYYDMVKFIYLLVLLILIIDLVRREALIKSGSLAKHKTYLFIISLTFVTLTIVIGILFSWLYDFQPQGRYIFPLIPIVMVYFQSAANYWSKTTKQYLQATALLLIILSCFSFRATALPYLVDIQFFNHYLH